MSTIEITHTHEAGTLVDGTARGDGSAPHLKAAGFRWSRNLGCWYLPQSRDRDAKAWKLHAARDALAAAGFEVTVSIDNAWRDPAQVRADRDERLEARRDALAAKAERHEAASTAAYTAAKQIADYIPAGQPILVGHHSERRHRRDLARLDAKMRASIDADKAATAAQHKLAGSAALAARRASGGATIRRIKRLEVDRRRLARSRARSQGLEGEDYERIARDYERELARIDAQLAHERAGLAALVAAGYRIYGPADFAVGQRVRLHGRGSTDATVLRVNPTTLTLSPDAAPMLRIKYGYEEVEPAAASAPTLEQPG